MDGSPPPPAPLQPHWNPTVFALVGSICMLFLIFSYYKLLNRCSSAFSFSRNQIDQPEASQNPSHEHQLYASSQGLDSCIVHSLPIICYRKNKANGNYDELELGRMIKTECCAVCLTEFEDGDWLRHLPTCSHAFHVACIDEWFRIHSSCPLCRSPAFDPSPSAVGQQYERSSEFLLNTLAREDFIHHRS
ncbi:E3 ubiquitin-protein ligase Os04g0590900-like [Impatiens glandulifera]|uniref:E3 ubiquitin-protein ligase Os04g0590900-like n=1 Tax=Impatiens glandulifera TaxID=253017 RepID=UPI001FB17DC8|nr:E3 ubiquitin-protein ligase Os04g0590900-like [Impatiens glandulifera]